MPLLPPSNVLFQTPRKRTNGETAIQSPYIRLGVRVPRKRQRVRSSPLIGSASARHHSLLAKVPALGPSHSRSRLATRQDLFRRRLFRDRVRTSQVSRLIRS